MYTRLNKRELEWFWHPHLHNALQTVKSVLRYVQTLYKCRMEGEQHTVIWHVRHQDDELLRVSAQLDALVNG